MRFSRKANDVPASWIAVARPFALEQRMYERHPLSAAFPSMDEEDLAYLTADIEAHGQREPGVLYEGMILDGWHRQEACERAGVEFVAVEFTGDDPVAFVISKNANRRHLKAGQRATAVVMCGEWAKSGRPKKDEPSSPFSTNEEMAKAAGTTVRTVQQAKTAVKAGLGEAVRDGKMSVKAAAEKAKPKPAPSSTPATEPAHLGAGTSDDAAGVEPDDDGAPSDAEQEKAAQDIAIRDAAEKKAHERLAFILLDEDDPLNAVMAENVKLTQLLAVAQSRIAGLQGENGKLITEIKKLQRKSK